MDKLDQNELKSRIKTIVEECDGIYFPFEAFYIQSIIYSAERACEAFTRYNKGLSNEANPSFLVSSVHEALGHAASLSRFFWPSGLGNKVLSSLKSARGAKLRSAFGLDDNSALRDRKLRDTLEHFDERLDRYLLNDPVGYFFPSPVIDRHELADEVIGNIFKLVDPGASCFVLLGEKHFFDSIRCEVEAVLEKAKIMDCNGGRLQPHPSKGENT